MKTGLAVALCLFMLVAYASAQEEPEKELGSVGLRTLKGKWCKPCKRSYCYSCDCWGKCTHCHWGYYVHHGYCKKSDGHHKGCKACHIPGCKECDCWGNYCKKCYDGYWNKGKYCQKKW